MRRKHTHAYLVTHTCARTLRKNTRWSNDGAPPTPFRSPWQWCHLTTRDSRGHGQVTTPPRLIRHKSCGIFFPLSLSFSLGGEGGGLSEDQTYRRPPVTHHHYISAQLAPHSFEVTLSIGEGGGGGRGGGCGASLSG